MKISYMILNYWTSFCLVLEDAHDNGVPSKHTTGAQVHQRQVILIDDLDDLVDDLDNDIPSKHTTGAQVHHRKVI